MRNWLVLVATIAFVSALTLRAADEPKEGDKKETKSEKADKPRKLRLTKPWSELTTLTDEQKAKIAEIHADYSDKRKQLEDEEDASIMALLSDESKAELEKYEAARKQADKDRNAARRAESKNKGDAPATKPSND